MVSKMQKWADMQTHVRNSHVKLCPCQNTTLNTHVHRSNDSREVNLCSSIAHITKSFIHQSSFNRPQSINIQKVKDTNYQIFSKTSSCSWQEKEQDSNTNHQHWHQNHINMQWRTESLRSSISIWKILYLHKIWQMWQYHYYVWIFYSFSFTLSIYTWIHSPSSSYRTRQVSLRLIFLFPSMKLTPRLIRPIKINYK